MAIESLTNPYESIGLLHNDGLDYIINNLGASPTAEEIINLSATYVCITCDNIASPTIWQKSKYAAYGAYGLNAYLCNDINKKPSRANSVSPYLYNKISNTILNASSRFNVRGDLETLEAELIKSEYSYDVLQPALIAIAVGKHSADYWNFQIDNIAISPWATYLNANFPDLDIGARNIIDADIITYMVVFSVATQLGGGDIEIITVTALVTAVVASAVSGILGWVKGVFS
jgi:hypothetical protein